MGSGIAPTGLTSWMIMSGLWPNHSAYFWTLVVYIRQLSCDAEQCRRKCRAIFSMLWYSKMYGIMLERSFKHERMM